LYLRILRRTLEQLFDRLTNTSVNPEGIELIDLEFVEKPLGVAAKSVQGHGFPWIEFGDVMGPDKRKLGESSGEA
jgi:hypothetical protein